MLLGATMEHGGYISIGGIWGFSSRAKGDGLSPVFEDETSRTSYYMKEKGKNWKVFRTLCPDLKKFEFWDENRTRSGTHKQELYLYENGLLWSSFGEKMIALENAGLREVSSRDPEDIALFPPNYTGEKYLYGSLVLSLPMPKHLQYDFEDFCRKEQKKEDN